MTVVSPNPGLVSLPSGMGPLEETLAGSHFHMRRGSTKVFKVNQGRGLVIMSAGFSVPGRCSKHSHPPAMASRTCRRTVMHSQVLTLSSFLLFVIQRFMTGTSSGWLLIHFFISGDKFVDFTASSNGEADLIIISIKQTS